MGALFYYGKALLQLSRMESGVLCNAMKGFSIDSEDMEDNEESSQVEDVENMTPDEKFEVGWNVTAALEENFLTIDKIAKTHLCEDSEDSESEDEMKDLETVEVDQSKKDDALKENGTETAEDTPNLQMSWEVTELAKMAFQKKAETLKDDEKKDAEAKYCEALMILGEISLEREDYSQAIEDFTLCLEKRKETLPADSRYIAETYYELGMAQGSQEKLTEAEDSLKSAISVLQTRVKNFGSMESSDSAIEEVTELENLIAEIKLKIEEYFTKGKMEVTPFTDSIVRVSEGAGFGLDALAR